MEEIYKLYFKLNDKLPKIMNFLSVRKKELHKFMLLYRNSSDFPRQKTHMNGIKDKKDLLCDVFHYLNQERRINYMSVDMTNFYLDKCHLLLTSTFKNHMTIALTFFAHVLKKYFNEIMEIRKTKLMAKCDLSREERIRKYDALLEHYTRLQKSKMYLHLKTKYISEFKTVIEDLETQVQMIFSISASN